MASILARLDERAKRWLINRLQKCQNTPVLADPEKDQREAVTMTAEQLAGVKLQFSGERGEGPVYVRPIGKHAMASVALVTESVDLMRILGNLQGSGLTCLLASAPIDRRRYDAQVTRLIEANRAGEWDALIRALQLDFLPKEGETPPTRYMVVWGHPKDLSQEPQLAQHLLSFEDYGQVLKGLSKNTIPKLGRHCEAHPLVVGQPESIEWHSDGYVANNRFFAFYNLEVEYSHLRRLLAFPADYLFTFVKSGPADDKKFMVKVLARVVSPMVGPEQKKPRLEAFEAMMDNIGEAKRVQVPTQIGLTPQQAYQLFIPGAAPVDAYAMQHSIPDLAQASSILTEGISLGYSRGEAILGTTRMTGQLLPYFVQVSLSGSQEFFPTWAFIGRTRIGKSLTALAHFAGVTPFIVVVDMAGDGHGDEVSRAFLTMGGQSLPAVGVELEKNSQVLFPDGDTPETLKAGVARAVEMAKADVARTIQDWELTGWPSMMPIRIAASDAKPTHSYYAYALSFVLMLKTEWVKFQAAHADIRGIPPLAVIFNDPTGMPKPILSHPDFGDVQAAVMQEAQANLLGFFNTAAAENVVGGITCHAETEFADGSWASLPSSMSRWVMFTDTLNTAFVFSPQEPGVRKFFAELDSETLQKAALQRRTAAYLAQRGIFAISIGRGPDTVAILGRENHRRYGRQIK